MKRQELSTDLRAAIEANTQRQSLEDLARQGKRHVRVVSGDKILQIIKGIVEETVRREASHLAAEDRDRIVTETKAQFDRVMRIQNEQDDLLREQKSIAADYKAKLEVSQRREQELASKLDLAQRREQEYASRLEQERAGQAAREGKLLAQHQSEIAALRDEQRRTASALEAMRAEQASREGKLLADSQRSAQSVREEQIQARARAERLEAEVAEARREAQASRAEGVESRARAERLDAELSAARREAAEAVRRGDEAHAALAKVEERLAHAKETIESFDGEIARLASDAKARDQLLERAREALAAREAEVARLDAIRQSLTAELGLARKEQVESAAVDSLRGELSEMKAFLASLDQRSAGPDRATLEALMQQLSQRESASTADLEKRFSATMDKTLEQIDKTLRSATSKPIDSVVEATDVLVGKIFDDETKMETNLEKLDIDTRTSQRGIHSNLERLKALRAAKKPAAEPAGKEGGDGAAEAPAAPSDSSRGPGPEEDPVSEDAKKRVNASMERLKAVREGATKNG